MRSILLGPMGILYVTLLLLVLGVVVAEAISRRAKRYLNTRRGRVKEFIDDNELGT